MKTLINAKRADLYLQLLALLIPFAWAVAGHDEVKLFYAYFSVGTMQIISCMVNKYLLPQRFKHPKRGRYEKWLLGMLIIAAALGISSLGNVDAAIVLLLGFGFLMLFAGAFMAFWYISITARELKLAQRLFHRNHTKK